MTVLKTRFAPSPTGYLHLGNVRTALFNDLLARSADGIFLLRIEDTDQTRSSETFALQLQEDLNWLGIYWNEGPGIEGATEKYFQSQRQAIYNEYYHRLETAGLVYPCFCTDQELAIARKVQLTAGKPPRYLGTCRNLTAEQVEQKKTQGLAYTLRFRVPDNQKIEFEDFVRGMQTFQSNEIGDFIISRSDRSPAFFFCNAIDDALMGITHVLRGEDHLTNTPRQLLILQALQLRQPAYGHISLIVGRDGSPLSKRHGSSSLKDLRELGYLPAAIVNYLARLGHYYANNAFMDIAHLAAEFSTKTLGSAPAHFDEDQLLYWQKQAVQHLVHDAFWDWIGEEVQAIVPAEKKDLFIETVRANIRFPADALYWAYIFFHDPLAYNTDSVAILRAAGVEFLTAAIAALKQFGTDFKAINQTLQQQLGVKGKALYQPLRIALTGELHGPEMAQILELLGVEKAQARLQSALQHAG